MKQRTTTLGLVLTIAAVFLGAAGLVLLIGGLGGTEGAGIAVGVVLLLIAGAAGVVAALRR